MVDLLTKGFEAVLRLDELPVGSSTACVATLRRDQGLLDVANLGDSGALVVQPDGQPGESWRSLAA